MDEDVDPVVDRLRLDEAQVLLVGRVVEEASAEKVASTSIGAAALLAKRSGADGEPHAGTDRHEHRLDGRFLVDEPGHVDDFVGV